MSDGLNILALDPGEKVGWARARVWPDATWTDLQHGITHLKDMALAVDSKAGNYDEVVCETWTLQPAKAKFFTGSDFPSVQFIGMVRLACWRENVLYVPQSPQLKSTADKTAPDWLQEIIAREPKAHDDGHNVDALRHLWMRTWERYVVPKN